MITLIFGQLNCGKHNVANSLKSQIDEEVVTLSDLRKEYLGNLLEDDLEFFLMAFCRHFTEKDMFIVVPNSCREVAFRCCSKMSHVRCILVAPSASAIVKRRRTSVKIDEYDADYFIPAEHYFNEESIHRNTARLVKETIEMAKAYNVSERFWCYVSPEYLF